MKKHPITVWGNSYKGSKPKLRSKMQESWRVAGEIEKFINDDMSKQPENCTRVYYSDLIAAKIGEDKDLVRSLIMSVDGGHNGITIYKGDYEKALDSHE